jgi:tetratricopeptide (TPR) repeat protein
MRTAIAGIAIAAALVLSVAAGTAWSQPPPDSSRDKTLREARSLARSGNFDAATRMLEPLYAANPDDATVVTALFQVLVEVKNYDRAEAVMKKYLEAKPQDPKGVTDLASLYLTTGKKRAAIDLVDKMIASAPEEPWAYQTGYGILWRGGAPDEAIDVILKGRKATGDSALFALEAAQIYKGASRYDAGTLEYLLAGTQARDPEVAVEGIVAMADSTEARKAILATLNGALTRPDFEQVARTCLWQIYLVEGDCARAFEQVSSLAQSGKLTPQVLTVFAARTRDRACYAECSRAYDLALGLPANRAQFPMLMLNKAGCELRGGLPDLAIATYGQVAKQYSDTKWACDAEMAMGRIYRDEGSYDAAIAEAAKVIDSRAAGDTKYDGILFKADCLVGAGNLEEAFTTYDLVGTDWKPNYAQEAFYNLGEIKFYQGSLEDAMSYYNVTLRQYPDEPRANDAIERLLLIKAVKGDLGTMWLKQFAQAMLLGRQRKLDEAAAILRPLAGEEGQGAIKTESIRALAAIALDRGDLDGAIKMYKLAGESLDTYFSPSALEAVGDVYLKQGKIPEAVAAYEEVILKFPESVSAGDARRKLDIAKRQKTARATESAPSKP